MDKLKEVKKIIQMMNEGSVTTQDLQTFITATLEFVKKQKDDFLQISQDSIDEIDKIVLYIEKEHEKTLQKVDEKSSKLEQELTKQIKEVKYLLEGAKNLIPQDGRDGLNGKDGKDGSPDTPEEIVKKINTTENSIDAKVIKDSATYVRKNDLDYAVSVLENQTRFLIASNSNRGSSTGGGGGGGTWGSITGTLSNQTDLQNALNLKYDASNPAGYITSSALSGYTPTSRTITINGTTQDLSSNRTWTIAVPTKTSDLTNDSGFITSSALSPYLPLTGAIYATTTGNGLSLTTSTLTTGSLVSLSSTGTGAGSNTQTVLNIATSGANGTSSQTTYGAYVTNTHTGTTSTNVGLYVSASGATNNYGLIVANGNVGIGQTSPTARLHIAAGTASAGTSPLKFTSGTNLTTPEAGAMEYDGTSLYFSPSTTRRTVVLDTATQTLTNKRINPRVQAVTSASTVTPSADNDDEVVITAQGAALTLANWSGTPVQGQAIIIRIKDDGTARAITFDTLYRAVGAYLPTTTVIGKTVYIACIYNSTDTKIDVVSVAQEI